MAVATDNRMTMSGFCAFPSSDNTSHKFCKKTDCDCECHNA